MSTEKWGCHRDTCSPGLGRPKGQSTQAWQPSVPRRDALWLSQALPPSSTTHPAFVKNHNGERV